MRSHSKHLNLITVTLLLSLTSPLFAFTCDFKPLIAQAQTAQNRKSEAERLLEEAGRQYQQRQYQKAIHSLQQAASIYREIGDHRQEREILWGIGALYLELAQYDQALKYAQQVLAIDQQLSDRRQERETLLGIGGVYLTLGQYDQIPKIFRQILAIDRELGDRRQPRSTLLVSGLIQEASSQFSEAESDETSQEPNSQLRERQYQKALELFQLALSLYHELGVSEAPPKEVRRLERQTVFMIGQTYLKLDQYDQGLKFFQESLALDQELGDRCQEQETLFKISSLYGVLGQYDQVLEGLDKILAINRELDKPCDTFLFHENDISDIYQRLGQPDQALKTLEQSLAFDRKVGDRIGEQHILLNISEIYEQQKQYEQALQFYQQALAISRELDVSEATPQEGLSHVSEPSMLTIIGEIYEQQGQYEQALESYQQALTLSREASNPYGARNSFMKLSRVYQRLGQYEQALESYQQALAAVRSVGNKYSKYIEEPYILMSLSQVYRQLGQDNQAREFYQQALAIGTKPGRGNREPSMRALNAMRALNDWGAVQTKKGQFQEALETFEKALAISRKVSQNLGNICTSAQPNSQNLGIAKVYPPKLAQAGSKCGSSMGQSGLEEPETLIFKNLGFVYRKLGQPEKSRESYEQALKRYQQKFARLRENNFSDLTVDELTIPREIAQIYEILGEDNLAQEFYRQAEKLEFLVQAEVIKIGVILGDVASGIVLTDDDTSPPRQSK